MDNVFFALTQNAALLLAMAFIYDMMTSRYHLKHRLWVQISIGLSIGLLGIILMLSPWQYIPGIVFDTRSVLLSISGLFFGTVPTTVAMIMTAGFRLSQGGAAAGVGAGVILSSGMLGMLWKYRNRNATEELTWWRLYLFGVVVHLVMLAFMLLLPWETVPHVLGRIALPVILIYPLVTAMLGTLMVARRRREQTAKALQASEERLRMALKASKQGLYDLNVQTGESIINAEYARLLGYEPKGFRETNADWIARMHPEDRPRVLGNYRDFLAGKTEEFHAEFRQRTPSGKWKWFLSSGKLVEHDADDQPLRMLGTLSDITDRRQSEEQTRRAEQEKAHLLEEAQHARLTLQRLFEEQKLASAEIERTSRLLAGVLNAASEVSIIATDPRGVITVFNRGAKKMLGYKAEEMIGLQTADALHLETELQALYQELNPAGDTPVRDFADFMAHATRTHAEHREWTYIGKHGKLIAVSLVVTAMRSPGGDIVGYLSIARDITKSKRQEGELRKLSQAVEQSPTAVMLTDPLGNIEYVNPKFTQTTGYSLEEVLGENPRILKSGETSPEEYRDLWNTITAGGEWHGEFHNKRKDGSLFWEHASISPVRDARGNISHFLAVKEDITDRKNYEEQLQHLATHDNLTGLANRALLQDRLEQSILFAKRSGRLVAALLLDLDRFKIINDSLGHSFGDQLLQIAADRLRESVRGADTVARLGGDEFVILLAEVANEEDVGKVAKKILDRLTAPFRIEDREITVTASLGISIYPRDGEDEETLIRNADVAMYRAKEERNAFCLYTPEMNIVVHEAMEMEADLRRALERNELLLHYQPKINLATNEITGAEALLRWQHPVRGMTPPGMFIPLAEETGLILPIGEWVLKEICLQIKSWQASGLKVLPIAANLSARQFRNDELVTTVRRILEEADLPPHLLELELTESMIMRDPQAAANTMQELSDLGVSLALDDFGTGYSSLNYLRRFPVDCLKIDRSFICDVAKDDSASAVATSIVAIAHSLGLQAVAEGLETEEQRDFLRQCGCNSYQGYLFSAPLDVKEFTEMLRTNT